MEYIRKYMKAVSKQTNSIILYIKRNFKDHLEKSAARAQLRGGRREEATKTRH